MINLLPPELKTGYVYGRKNVTLRKWVMLFAVALIGLGAITTYGLLTIRQSTVDYEKKISVAQKQLEDNDYNGTQQKVKDLTGSLKLVVKVLGQEVLFSKLLQKIAVTIPPNASLTGLNISQVQGGIDISATAQDYQTATQVQVNLADPKNEIFSKADILNINCSPTSAVTVTYPCSVNIRALFAPNNPFLFISSQGVKP